MTEITVDICTAQRIIGSLDGLGRVSGVELLREGYSADAKYVIYVDGEQRYLVRFSDISGRAVRFSDYTLLSELHACGVACCEPFHFGVSEADGVCFMVIGYIAGESAHVALPKLNPQQQYCVGISAGQTLSKMHHALEADFVDWYNLRSARYRDYQRESKEMGISYEGQDNIDAFINDHLPLMKGRPTTFRHGDYHPGNLVVRDGSLAGVIDFDRCGWGDPYYEFYKVAQFGAPLSPDFACGQVDGYFPAGVPDDFWPLYNLYVAMVLLVDLVWTQSHCPNDMAPSRELGKKIIEVHDFVSAGPPKWYAPRQGENRE